MIALLFIGLLATPPTDAALRDRTNTLIQAFLAVKPAPADNAGAFAALDGYLNRQAMLDGALGPHAKAFKPEQRARYDKEFWQLLRRVAYPDSAKFFRTAKYSITAVKPGTPSVVSINGLVEKDDLETDIAFTWADSGGQLQIVDVAFDGASLLTDYQNQFGRIIAKKGVDGLLDTITQRLAKLEAPGKPAPK
jgi:ABC-type transporter MlaC component